MNLSSTLPTLLGIAWLLPLASFVLILFFGKHMGSHGKGASYVACAAIIGAFLLSAISLVGWLGEHPFVGCSARSCNGRRAHLSKAHVEGVAPTEHVATPPVSYSGDWYTLAEIGKLKITIGWYIDALTVAMFCMVTLIASCIHVYTPSVTCTTSCTT